MALSTEEIKDIASFDVEKLAKLLEKSKISTEVCNILKGN